MSIILIDANSVGHASNAAARLTAGDMETQAIFGFIYSLRELMVKNPGFTPVCLWDGVAKWRYELHSGYKSNRVVDAEKELKPYEKKAHLQRQSYREQKPHIIKIVASLGVKQIIPQDDEADDLAGYLSKTFDRQNKKTLLVSRDHDWLQLVSENTTWYNPVEHEAVNHLTFSEYTGYQNPRQFVEEKCLVGDTSDCIGGVSGIGEKAAPLIIHHWGSVEAMLDACKDVDDKWVPPTKELRRYKKKILEFAKTGSEGRKIYQRNLKLMNLIDTPKPANIRVLKESINRNAFIELCRSFAFHSIIRKQDSWLEPFENKQGYL